jgi:threonine/homoserine/homoserine lactone efflux protein
MIGVTLIKGIGIGFTIGAVVGPIGLLCLRRSLSEGFLAGLVTGLGAVLADAIYGAIAAFGLTALSDFLISYASILRIAGAAYLVYLGIKTFIMKPVNIAAGAIEKTYSRYIIETFFLTLTSPVTILAFISIFSTVGINLVAQSWASSATLVLGIFLGSGLWWILLSGLSSIFRTKLTTNHLAWINRVTGTILILFGVLALVIR